MQSTSFWAEWKRFQKKFGKVYIKLYLPEKKNDGNNDDTITGPIKMAKKFNNFFTSLGTNLQKKIPLTKKTFTDYLKTLNSKNFIIAPTTLMKLMI